MAESGECVPGAWLSALQAAVREAGAAILRIYGSADVGIEYKADDSPLTQADCAAHDILFAALTKLGMGPVLSEEGAAIAWPQRREWEQYWLVDPLDGTKEFIKRNGEFTVNVALVWRGIAVAGIVHAPALQRTYWGVQSHSDCSSTRGLVPGAWRQSQNDQPCSIHVDRRTSEFDSGLRVLGSRSHTSPDFDRFLETLPQHQLVSMGSSLKFCLLAEGAADLYPRFVPTAEWDTAAGQAVLEAAGGCVLDWESHRVLRYNSKSSLLNPNFIAASNQSLLRR